MGAKVGRGEGFGIWYRSHVARGLQSASEWLSCVHRGLASKTGLTSAKWTCVSADKAGAIVCTVTVNDDLINPPNVADWALHQLCIRDVRGSDLGVKQAILRSYAVFCRCSKQMLGYKTELGSDRLFPITPNSLFFNFTYSGRCIVKATKRIVKRWS